MITSITEYIATKQAAQQGGPVGSGSGGGAREGGAATAQKPVELPLTAKVLKQFYVDTEPKGQPVLLRWVKRNKAWRWCAVVAVEDLPAIFRTHHTGGLGCAGINKLYQHVSVGGCIA